MSTWSKVRRQVRRNAREVPKASRRREALVHAGRWVPLSPIYIDVHDRMLAADAMAFREIFNEILLKRMGTMDRTRVTEVDARGRRTVR